MLISAVSSSASNSQVLNPVLYGKPAATSSSASAKTSASSSPTSAATTSTTSSSTASTNQTSRSGSSHSGGAGSGSSSAATEEETLVSGYSTTVGGKQYSGSVEESNGEYTASVSGLSGANASGSSITGAENNLNSKIDELV
jgi:hypothetical protein